MRGAIRIMKLTIDDVRSRFIKHFDGSTGNVYAAPGRINLIGEHTDYNNGFVFPGAVEQGMIAEIKPNGTRCRDSTPPLPVMCPSVLA